MSYSVKYEDLGLRDYKDVWDYQATIFNILVENKKKVGSGEDGNNKQLPGTLIFVEHPHVYTLGKSGSGDNMLIDRIQLQAKNAGFYRIDRGGDITYHGPGQIVGYPIFDIERLGISLKEYVWRIEEAIIRALDAYGIPGARLAGGTGVWLDPGVKGKARKICAIGIRASRYVTMHGFAFNVNTDLSYFNYINPCGFTDKGVTSLARELGGEQNIEAVKKNVRIKLKDVFDLAWTNLQE